MPDFLVKLTCEVHLIAKGQEEAEERAGELVVEVKRPEGRRWTLSDIEDLEVTVQREDY